MFVGLALVMLATSCTTDVTSDVNVNGAKVTLGVSLDQTRTYMGNAADGEYPVLWSEGDKVLVNNVAVAVPSEAVGKSELKLAADAAEKYELAYPAELVEDGVLTISEVQKFVEGSFAQGAGVMVGYSTTEEVTLKNLYGYLKFTVTAAENVNAVTVTAADGEAISGTFALDYKNATITPLAGKDIIRVTDVVATKGVATVVVAVPAGEYTKGFTVKVKANDKGVMTKTLQSDGHVVEAGVVYALPAVAYAEAAKETAIMSVADLQAFIEAANTVVEVEEGQTAPCTYTDWISEDGEVKLGADLNLEGVDLTPINTFDGVFNGQGFALKNWNTTHGLFTQNFGTVKNVVIDANSTFTVVPSGDGDQNFAFIVADNQPTGVVAGCVNNGNVTVPTAGYASGANRIAGVVGASYGFLRDCINNGNVEIISATASSKVQCIAGVVGYLNPNAGTKDALTKDFVVNCVNNGAVKVVYEAKPGNVCVGGIAGCTQATKLYDSGYKDATHLGCIKNCVNNGAVYYEFKTLGSGSYGNVGGVIGYSQADVVNCDNYGTVSYIVPIPEDKASNATCPACAGVVGKTLYNVENCNNYGAVNVSGIWAAGTNGATRAGGSHQDTFGGVVGFAGLIAATDANGANPDDYYKDELVKYSVKKCNNYGAVTVNAGTSVNSKTHGYFGGVIGGASIAVSECANYGVVKLTSFVARVWMGGVLGYGTSSAEKCYNYNTVELTIDDTARNTAYSQVLGGVIGQAESVDNCANNATTKLVVNDGMFTGKDIYTAGVAGYANESVTNCALNADVTVTMNTTATVANVKLGGVVGQIKTISGTAQPIDNCKTAENVKVTLKTKAATGNNFVGGVIAQSNNGIKDCVNKAAVELEWLVANNSTSKGCAVAGVAALQKQLASGCSNEGEITIKMNNSTCFIYAAGIVGNHQGTMSDCSNKGNIAIEDYVVVETVESFYGGLAAKLAATATVGDDCTDTGVITINGEAL